jgi:hypothetical protein
MPSTRRALVWLAIAAVAILLGYADLDLRLLAVIACAGAALAGTGALDRRPGDRSQPVNSR